MRNRRAIGRVAVAVALAGAVLVTTMSGYLVYLRSSTAAEMARRWAPGSGGSLVICGGAVPADVHQCFIDCAGGSQARLVIIPAYVPSTEDVENSISNWRNKGVASAVVLHATDRAQADTDTFCAPIGEATCVWIGGGDQRLLADLYVGTKVERELQTLLKRGGVIGGVSAGAAAMTKVMIVSGADQALEQRGFDLLPGAVVDQHFFQRNRAQRLLGVLADHAGLVGLGIDEQTGVVIRNGRWSVVGRSYAMICLPTADRFPRIELLKPGDETDIETLKEQPGTTAISTPSYLDALLGTDAER